MFRFRSILRSTRLPMSTRQSSRHDTAQDAQYLRQGTSRTLVRHAFSPHSSLGGSQRHSGRTRLRPILPSAMSVNVTVNIPLSSFLDLKAGRTPECGPDVLQALLRAIRTSPCEVIRKQCAPLAIEAPPLSKKITYTKVTRFRKPDDPPVYGVLLVVEGSVDNKKYRIDPWTKMSSLKAALSKTNGIDLNDFSLYYQGSRVKDSDTPDNLGMRSHDKVQMRKIVRPK